MSFATADLIDRDGNLPSCDLQLCNFGKRTRFSGRVRTVRCHQDNALLKQMLSTPATATSSSLTAGVPFTPLWSAI